MKYFYLRLIFPLLLLSFTNAFAQQREADSLLNILKTAKADTVKVNALLGLSMVYQEDDKEKTITYANQAMELAEKCNFPKGKARALHMRGSAYFDKGELDKAMKDYTDALAIFRELDLPYWISLVEYYQGIVYVYKGDYNKGLENFFDALKTQEKLGDKERISSSYMAIAAVYGRKGDFSKEMEYQKKGLKIKQETNDKYGISAAYINIGNVFARTQQFDSAIVYYQEGLGIAQEIGNKKWTLSALGNIGTVYLMQGQPEKAMPYFKQAGDISEKMGDKHGLLVTYNMIGSAYEQMKDYPNALIYAQKAQAMAEEAGDRSEMKAAYETLSLVYADMNNYKEAYRYRQLFEQAKDSLLNEANSKQMNEMLAKYESEKKEKEIELLNKENALNAANLKKQEMVRNFLFGIIGLALCLGVVLAVGYRNKRKANRQLTALNSEIMQQKEEIQHQKHEIEEQKEILEEKNKDITDSIHYAKRIQRAIFPSAAYLQKYLPEHFIFYQPKDIVSGDFYWAYAMESSRRVMFATADCTGHGVPGAFMSMIGTAFLNEIVIERRITRPDMVLEQLRMEVIKALNPEGSEEEAKDGMDIVLCSLDMEKRTLEYAAAYNSFYIIRDGTLLEQMGDKFPVGKHNNEQEPFTFNSIALEKGDVVYTFTDGYADQFGGPSGKKFKYKQLQDLLLSIHREPMAEQRNILFKTLESWRGNLEQVDDILVIGTRIS